MDLYGLHDRQLRRIVELYTSPDAAEVELATIAADDPEWAAQLEVVRVESEVAENPDAVDRPVTPRELRLPVSHDDEARRRGTRP